MSARERESKLKNLNENQKLRSKLYILTHLLYTIRIIGLPRIKVLESSFTRLVQKILHVMFLEKNQKKRQILFSTYHSGTRTLKVNHKNLQVKKESFTLDTHVYNCSLEHDIDSRRVVS